VSMNELTRRRALKLFATTAPALAFRRSIAAQMQLQIAPGKYIGTRESLRNYQPPDWFRDAKFGIWAHWGPQSAIEDGDWYARNMYIQGSNQYAYHLANYGHPSKVGYKDIVGTWKAAKWDPDNLMSLYKKAGAQYFVSMGVHHDNFDLWDSRHTRWNAVQMGPKRDVVGTWKQIAQKHGLKFGVSEHLWISYRWFSVSHGADKTGALTSVSYDGTNPDDADLYHDANCAPLANEKLIFNDDDIPLRWKQHYFDRIKDLVDRYQPDLLYTDGHLPFEEFGLNMVANLYNQNPTAVYTSKRAMDCADGDTCVLDRERRVADDIWPDPWQTDTCIGQWHYKRGQEYKSPKKVIDMLVDIVSKNGNLLLNIPLPNSGEPDREELAILDSITKWMAVNSEGIYATRPWKIYGDGPSTQVAPTTMEGFNESKKPELTAADIRFTTKGKTLYAFIMGWPQGEVLIQPLGTASRQKPKQIVNVEMLGFGGKLVWKQETGGLRVQMPSQPPSEYGITIKATQA
jgi:alpha-L-fucosidase